MGKKFADPLGRAMEEKSDGQKEKLQVESEHVKK